jgi:hypothetical protein
VLNTCAYIFANQSRVYIAKNLVIRLVAHTLRVRLYRTKNNVKIKKIKIVNKDSEKMIFQLARE